MQSLVRGRSLECAELEVEVFASPPSFGPEFFDIVRKVAKTRDMIVIDTLAAFNPGIDENTAAMGEPIYALANIAHSTGCAIVIAIHDKKTSGGTSRTDPLEKARGSSAIQGAVDVMLGLERVADDTFTAHARKVRDIEGLPTLEVMLVKVGGGIRLVARRVERNDGEKRAPEPDDIDAQLLTIIQQHAPASQRQIAELARKRRKVVADALKRLGDRVYQTTTGVFVVAHSSAGVVPVSGSREV